jgi:hypothetical protein
MLAYADVGAGLLETRDTSTLFSHALEAYRSTSIHTYIQTDIYIHIHIYIYVYIYYNRREYVVFGGVSFGKVGKDGRSRPFSTRTRRGS